MACWLFSLSSKGGTLFREAWIGWPSCLPKASFQRPDVTSSLGGSPHVAWSSLPQGNHTNFKEHLLSIFCPQCYSVYWKPEIFSDGSHCWAAPLRQNRRRRHHLSCFSLSVCFSVCFSFTRLISFPSFTFFTENSTEICALFSKYIQSNLITAITFLLGWLTVLPVPLNAAAFPLYIPKLLIPPQPSCTFTGALANTSIPRLLFHFSRLSLFLLCLLLVRLFSQPDGLFSRLSLFLVCSFNSSFLTYSLFFFSCLSLAFFSLFIHSASLYLALILQGE